MKKKKIILTVIIALSSVTATMAQISFKGTWCYKDGEKISDVWVSPKGSRLEYIDPKTGNKTISIVHFSTMKVYMITGTAKRCLVIDGKKFSSTNDLAGVDLIIGEQKHRKHLGQEEIEGKMCEIYQQYSTAIDKYTGKERTEGGLIYYIYPPMTASNYSGVIAREGMQFKRLEVLRNIQTGPQPDSLFEIPEGYEIVNMPAGGLMEMVTGKSKAENQKGVDNALDAINDAKEKIDKDAESEADKFKAVLKQLEQLNNNKKKK